MTRKELTADIKLLMRRCNSLKQSINIGSRR